METQNMPKMIMHARDNWWYDLSLLDMIYSPCLFACRTGPVSLRTPYGREPLSCDSPLQNLLQLC
jgi:hypothetical protein